MSDAHTYNTTIKKLPKSSILLTASIPTHEWEGYRGKAIKELNEHVSLDGFRKGKVPESILIQKIGESAILEEMAEIAVTHAYAHIITTEKLRAIGKPKVELTKITKGEPLEFTLETAVLPEIELPNYQKIAVKEGVLKDEAVTDEEIKSTIADIQRMRAHKEAEQTGADEKDIPLPEITDEYVKTLGGFANVSEFTTKLKEQLSEEKQQKARDKRRNAILDGIAGAAKVDLTEILIEGETSRMIDQFKSDIARVGGTWEDYLTHAKKTEAELRKEWRPDASKRATLQLALDAIAEKEELAPDNDKVRAGVEQIIQAYPDANAEKAEDYIRYTETNRLVIEFLEKAADTK